MTAPLLEQVRRLADLGVLGLAGLDPAEVLAASRGVREVADAVLVVHPGAVAASALAPLLEHDGRRGFVVEDMTDVDEFEPVPGVELPDGPLYLLRDVHRGDDLVGWTPADAEVELRRRGRTPLTLGEGLSWLLQQPEQLEPNRCPMTIGSRKPRASGGSDARTPAVWISGGTGRDGRERRGAPKVGWCWWGNHHTWLGFASAAERLPLT